MTTPSRLADIAIVGHTARLDAVTVLADTVDARAVVIDDGTLGCEANHLRAWGELSWSAAPWGVVLEDDALPVRDFLAQLDDMLSVAPTPIVSLYLGRTRPPLWQPWIRQSTINANRQDACFIPARRLLHCVGVAIRTPLINDMLATVSARPDLPIDEGIHAWAEHAHHPMAYCWPSIVDHHDGPTLVAHRDGAPRTEPRVAWSCGSRSPWRSTTLEA